jgi:hypothetical protein
MIENVFIYIVEDILYNVYILEVTTAQFGGAAKNNSCDTDTAWKIGNTFYGNISQCDRK